MERELLQKRGECLAVCERLIAQAGQESRDFNAEEQQQYDRAWGEAGDIEKKLEASRNATAALQVRTASIQEARSRKFVTGNLPGNLGTMGGGTDQISITFRNKPVKLKPGSAEYHRASQAYNDDFEMWLRNPGMLPPSSSLQTTEAGRGGYLIMPEQTNYDLLRVIEEAVVMRQICRQFVTRAESLGGVYRKSKASGFVWGTEITAAPALTDPEYGKKKLTPAHYTAYTNPTNDFLAMSEVPAAELVTQEMQIPAKEGEETALCSGDGNGKPLGVFTASNNGIDTSRDIASGSATNITYDGLCDTVGAISDNYLINGQCYWVCHRDFLTKCWKLKDSTGQPILKTEANGKFFYSLMGFPVLRSDFAPNTFTNGLYVAVFGNFQYYWIADNPMTEIKVLDQIQALDNRTVFLFRRKMDGLPVRPKAFARVKCST